MKKMLLVFVLGFFVFLVSGCAAGYMKMVKAAEKGDMASVDAILAENPSVLTEEDFEGKTALMHAAAFGKLELAKLLVKKGADVNYKSKDNGATALMWAAEYADVDMIKYLLKAGADVKILNDINRNAVHWAAMRGNLKTLEAVLAAGGDAKVRDKQNLTPIQVAAYGGNPDCVQYLIKKGYYDDGLKFTKLIKECIKDDKKKTVKAVIKAGAEENAINTPDFMGKTPLMWAVITGNTGLLKGLINANANINAVDNLGNSGIQWAVIEQKTSALEMLLDAGASPDTHDKSDGKTPLMTSIIGNNMEAFHMIMRYKNDYNAFKNNGSTALGLAKYFNNGEAYTALYNAGARMTERPKEQPNPEPKKYDDKHGHRK